MNCFLDTSALIKLYHEEQYSLELKQFLFSGKLKISALLISELTILEFPAATWRKTRTNQPGKLTHEQATALLLDFENDQHSYSIVAAEAGNYDNARWILNKCNAAGFPLRTLDALQLWSALNHKTSLDAFITFDQGMLKAATFMELPVQVIPPPIVYIDIETVDFDL